MSNIVTDTKKIDQILDRGVIAQTLPPKEDFKKLLLSGKRLRIYLGIDPTSTSLHLGHAENIMLLEDFRSLGHETIIVMGSFTAQIGDPSGKSNARTPLSEKEVKINAKHIAKQVGRILKLRGGKNPAKIAYNSDWLGKLKFKNIVDIASNFTVQQMLERDMFQKRIGEEKPIFLHEFFYPLMQGYDSVQLDVDVEIGGTDQIFNMLAGRTLLKRLSNKDKFVVAVNLMANPKTGELMSKSNGTGVFLDSTASEMFGQIMAQPDEMIKIILINNTRLPLDEVGKISKGVEGGGNKARNAKLKTAREVVAMCYSEKEADLAQEDFVKTFSEGGVPKDTPVIKVSETSMLSLVIESGLVRSRTEARRLIEDGAVSINGKVIDNLEEIIDIEKETVLKIGKKRFAKIERK